MRTEYLSLHLRIDRPHRTNPIFRIASAVTVAVLFSTGCQSGETHGNQNRLSDWVPEKPHTATTECTVTKIIDGDTIHCEPVGRIRLIGMDTPERGQKPFGPMATAAIKALAPVGSAVEIEFDVDRTDRYGRILGYVWAKKELVNWRLVRDGYAMIATYPPNVSHVDQFVDAQRAAREDRLGLWEIGGFDCSPSEYRKKLCR
jgi:endonuclease YncB( thermonuclease family)